MLTLNAAGKWYHSHFSGKIFKAIDTDENDRLEHDELERVVSERLRRLSLVRKVADADLRACGGGSTTTARAG